MSESSAEIPDIVLRTTLITGFPGETEEDHEELKEFVDEMEFDRLGVFTYSPEENTPAAEMVDQIPEEVKEERRDELMELQQEISYDRGQDRIGQELLVMIEEKLQMKVPISDVPMGMHRRLTDIFSFRQANCL